MSGEAVFNEEEKEAIVITDTMARWRGPELGHGRGVHARHCSESDWERNVDALIRDEFAFHAGEALRS